MIKNFPLVSIVIISYNSEEFILEALESAKAQTYNNIELIISDDGSTDSTTLKVEQWLLQNEKYFISCKFIKSNKNTGITCNVNRGVLVATGKYIKLIAADDVILENCIKDLVDFVETKNILFCYSYVLPFSNDNNEEYIKNIIEKNKLNYDYFFNKSQKEQYYALLRLTIPLSIIIGGFYSQSILKEINYFNETYEMMEDYPLMIRLAKLGYKFNLLTEYTSKYRIRDMNDMDSFKRSKRYIVHYNNLRVFRKNEVIPLMRNEKMYISMLYLKIVMKLLDIENKYENSNYNKLMKLFRNLKQYLMELKI